MKTPAIAILLALTCMAATSCRSAPSDSSITADVKTQLAGLPGTITVATNDSVVALSGTVPDVQDKLRAGDLANEVSGVTRVVNNLRPMIAGDVPAPPPGAAPPDQANPHPANPMP